MGVSTWTPESEEALRALWAEGLSATQIAGRLGGGATRGSVVGKAHRMNLPPRSVDLRRSNNIRAVRERQALAPATATRPHDAPGLSSIPREPRPMPAAEAAPSPRTLVALSARQCHWPISDPGAGNGEAMLFCARRCDGGGSYCAEHRVKMRRAG